MKMIVEHLAEILITVAAIALLIGAVLALATPAGDFFSGVFSKLEDQADEALNANPSNEGKPPLSVITSGYSGTYDGNGHSITVNGQWIPQKTSPAEILKNTPNRIDRIKIAHMLIKSTKKIKQRELECKEKLKNENQRNTT